jgi:hypothetical protein
MEKTIIGLVEEVLVTKKDGSQEMLKARIDTGAKFSSVDHFLLDELNFSETVREKTIKQSHGKSIRPVVIGEVVLHGKKISAEFTVSMRSHMRYPMLIGQNILKEGFLIDPSIKSVSIPNKK